MPHEYFEKKYTIGMLSIYENFENLTYQGAKIKIKPDWAALNCL